MTDNDGSAFGRGAVWPPQATKALAARRDQDEIATMLITAFAALALDTAPVPAGACKDPFGRIVTCLKADPHTLDANPEVPTTANTRKGTAGRCYWTSRTAEHVPGQFTRCPKG